MEAKEATLLRFFEENQNNQFVIPIYQRLYSWKKEQCEQLWDDIIKIGGNDKMNGHFIGSILYVRDGITHSNNPLLIFKGGRCRREAHDRVLFRGRIHRA